LSFAVMLGLAACNRTYFISHNLSPQTTVILHKIETIQQF
jgi:hypothetical protein